MSNILRGLILIMFLSIVLTILHARGTVHFSFSHMQLGTFVFIYVLFVEAFIMFFFIGISRFCRNVLEILTDEKKSEQYFEIRPDDMGPYQKKAIRFVHDSNLFKRKVIPWCMLIQVLGALGLFLGGAYDTRLVDRIYHVGVIYGLLLATVIGLITQWQLLGKGNKVLREIKGLFQIPDSSM